MTIGDETNAKHQPVTQGVVPPRSLPLSAITNMCFGTLGVQIIWGLQNVDTSRIFQTLGAKLDDLPILWIAAPVTGLLVQPVVGHLSDRTWGPFGRRKPYLLGGAIVAAAALIAMPLVHALWAAVLMLWLLTGATNVAMEPFRALIADIVPDHQRNTAYAAQVVFIGTGAVIASALPWMLSHGFGFSDDSPVGIVPPALSGAFLIGAIGLLLTVGITVVTTREPQPGKLAGERQRSGRGVADTVAATDGSADRYRPGRLATLRAIADDVRHMPTTMRRLAAVQFFTWFALFALWIYAVPVVAARCPQTRAGYNICADRVGLLFALYNAVAVVAAFGLPSIIRRLGRARTHAVMLLFGAAGLVGFTAAIDTPWLWLAPIALGLAWASILSTPYAIVASVVPASRMGAYMGIHNIFLVLPQIVATQTLGWIIAGLLGGHVGSILVLASLSMLLAAILAVRLEPGDAQGR